MTSQDPTDEVEAEGEAQSRPPTPTEQVLAIPRPASEPYHHHMANKKLPPAVGTAVPLNQGSKPIPSSWVRVEKRDETIELKVDNRIVTMTKEEARELGATLMQLAR